MMKILFEKFMKATIPQKLCYFFGILSLLIAFWGLIVTFLLKAVPYVALAILGIFLILLGASKKI